MSENVENLFIFIVFFEFFEFFWQGGDTLKQFIQNLLHVYQKGIVLFIFLHPSFFFVLFCVFALNLKSPILLVIAIFKFADICFKISLLNRLNNHLPLGNFEAIFENDYPLSTWVKLMPLIMYSTSFYLSF